MMRQALVAIPFVLFIVPLAEAFAGVILVVDDDGTDTTFQWTGTMDVGVTSTNNSVTLGADFYRTDSEFVYSGDGDRVYANDAGRLSGNDPFINANSVLIIPSNSVAGFSFGYGQETLFWDRSLGTTPGVIAPNRRWTAAGVTVADLFGTNLDTGPVLLWTNLETGDTISVGRASVASQVPEATSLAIFGLGAVGLAGGAIRRRKKQQA